MMNGLEFNAALVLVFIVEYVYRYGFYMLGENGSSENNPLKDDPDSLQFFANGVSIRTFDIETKLDQGNIQQAQSELYH